MDQNRIARGIFYAVIVVVAGLAGFFVKKVLVDGGTFALSSLEIFEVVATGVLVGIIVPIVEAKKKN
ncbi:MAG: hypothetical protein E7000_04455 [Coriobacteriaceae bacterium]|nr:hypothetical protein [Coriobacteriaceae bacterium]